MVTLLPRLVAILAEMSLCFKRLYDIYGDGRGGGKRGRTCHGSRQTMDQQCGASSGAVGPGGICDWRGINRLQGYVGDDAGLRLHSPSVVRQVDAWYDVMRGMA